MAITRIGKPAIADVRGVNYRNIVINGDMSVAQRGTSSTNVSSGYHTCDRWRIFRGAGTITMSQETDAPTGSGFIKSLKLTSSDCLNLKIIDEIIPELHGGAHRFPNEQALLLKEYLKKNLDKLVEFNVKELVKNRNEKFLNITQNI